VNWDQLAQALKEGLISLGEWTSQMRALIVQEQDTAMMLIKGGREFVTFADWGYVGSEVKKQYAFLDNFAKDIADNPQKWLTGRLDNRMNLYRESGYAALERFERREKINDGFTEERRVLGAADHCTGCLAQASLGWQPIGTLDEIGAEECSQNCKCEFEYRKAGEGE